MTQYRTQSFFLDLSARDSGLGDDDVLFAEWHHEASLRERVEQDLFYGALREAIEDVEGALADREAEPRQPWAWTNPGFHSAG